MKSAKEELYRLENLKDFSAESRQVWENFLDYISEDDAVILLNIFDKDPKTIDFLIKNLLIKNKNQKNKKELKNLLKKEKAF